MLFREIAPKESTVTLDYHSVTFFVNFIHPSIWAAHVASRTSSASSAAHLPVAHAPDNRSCLLLLEHGDAMQLLSLSWSSNREDAEEEVEEEDDDEGSTP